jgi:Alpha-L-arabinofuranosidase B, catalytic
MPNDHDQRHFRERNLEVMSAAPDVSRTLQLARTLLLSGMVGGFLLGCSSSSGDTWQGTGGNSNAGGGAGGSTATGGVTSTGGSSSSAGGSMSTGGSVGTGGSGATGGSLVSGGSMATGTGGAPASGGVATGGMRNTGGATGTGGSVAPDSATAAGGITSTGGTTATGGTIAAGGITSAGGTRATGGTVSTGGAPPTGDASATGGRAGSGGTGGTGGTSGSGGATTVTGPCDIYASGNAPCVAAHSTVRALFSAYSGNLYQVKKADGTTKDIGVLAPGGFANASAQDTFCSGTTCTISIIYDQSAKGNHLRSAPAGGAKNSPDSEANATALKLTVGGHTVYGVHIPAGVGYRNDKTSGIATGDQPESEYMVTSGNYYNGGCCFDYGNAETNNKDDNAGTMEAVYFGNSTGWGKGTGAGPWVMADLEDGLFAGKDFGPTATNTPLTSTYVTAMVTGRSGTFAIKGGNSQSGTLTTMYDGARPTMTGYNPMKKQGAIILGIGGDNSNSAQGNFFEGCMTSAASSNATDDAVQANIVAAGYGR